MCEGGAGVVVVLVLLGAAAAVAAVLRLAAVTVPLLPPLLSILPTTSRLQNVIVHYFREIVMYYQLLQLFQINCDTVNMHSA